jgi:hypothetical protein
VDLEEVARRAAPLEVRVKEGHREHGRRRGGEVGSSATSCGFELRSDELVLVLDNRAANMTRQPTPAAGCSPTQPFLVGPPCLYHSGLHSDHDGLQANLHSHNQRS